MLDGSSERPHIRDHVEAVQEAEATQEPFGQLGFRFCRTEELIEEVAYLQVPPGHVVGGRIVQGEGVERIFPLHSPKIAKIEVKRTGRVRRAKLYYLRDRVGKATRLRERRVKGSDGESAKRAPAEVPAWSGGPAPSGCTFWQKAQQGQTFYTVPADHYNCAVGAYTHKISLPAERQTVKLPIHQGGIYS